MILLYGRPPRKHLFPVNLFVRELDASDPFTFLFLKRGILRKPAIVLLIRHQIDYSLRCRMTEYVQVKPILTAATLILKATGTYKEGELSWSAGYLYVSFVYNISICLRYAPEDMSPDPDHLELICLPDSHHLFILTACTALQCSGSVSTPTSNHSGALFSLSESS